MKYYTQPKSYQLLRLIFFPEDQQQSSSQSNRLVNPQIEKIGSNLFNLAGHNKDLNILLW